MIKKRHILLFDEEFDHVLLNVGPNVLEPLIADMSDDDMLYSRCAADLIESVTGLDRIHHPGLIPFMNQEFRDRKILWSYGLVQKVELLQFVNFNKFLRAVPVYDRAHKIAKDVEALLPYVMYFHYLPPSKRPKP